MQEGPGESAPVTGDDGSSAVLAVANAAAGSAQHEQVAAAVVRLRRHADVDLARTRDPDDLRSALADLGERRLVVLGGDGSVHAAVQALSDLDALSGAGPLGIVPLGTGNDLARSLGLPLDPVQAADVAATGTPQHLEMLRDDAGGVVVNAVHAGLGADAAARAERRKGRLGRLAYSVGAVQAGASDRGYLMRVTVDGEVVNDVDDRLLMVALGLGTSIGGGARVAPGAVPFDGQVDVVLSTSTGPLARVAYAATMRDGRHLGRHDVTRLHGCEVLLEALEDKGFRTNADGEVTGPWQRRRWTVAPRAWTVLVPRHSRAGSGSA